MSQPTYSSPENRRFDVFKRWVVKKRRVTRMAPALPNLVWALLFFVIPFGLMAVYSLAQQDPGTAEMNFNWTTENYERVGQGLILAALARSLLMSTAATLLCILIAYPLAYFIAHHSGRLKPVFLVLVIIPFWTSFVIRTYAWLGLLKPQGLTNNMLQAMGLVGEGSSVAFTPLAIVIGIVYNYLPLMIFPLFVSLNRIDKSVLEAAGDLGASSFSTFRRVIFPQALPGMVAGIIVVGVPATGEYVIPAILGGGKTLMFGNLIAAQFGSAFAWPFGAALATVLTALLLAMIVVLIQAVGRERLGSELS